MTAYAAVRSEHIGESQHAEIGWNRRTGGWHPCDHPGLPGRVRGGRNTREVDVAEYGTWTTKITVDTFDDSELSWLAFHPQGGDGGFATICLSGDTLTFEAYADNWLIDTIGSAFSKDEPIRVRAKIDDREIIEVRGEYPNTLTANKLDVLTFLSELLEGDKSARVRTEHGEEQHSFALSLNGFGEAAVWVLRKCGWTIDPTKSTEDG